jgi:hypothetical protein
MDKLKELFHTKTPKEVMQENKRAIRRARRELEREKNRLNNEKTRNENEIRKLAAKGEQVQENISLVHESTPLPSARKHCEPMRRTSLVNGIKSINWAPWMRLCRLSNRKPHR